VKHSSRRMRLVTVLYYSSSLYTNNRFFLVIDTCMSKGRVCLTGQLTRGPKFN
jgi:hypothetical protein